MKALLPIFAIVVCSCSEPTFQVVTPESADQFKHLRPQDLTDHQWEQILLQHFASVRDNEDFSFYGRVEDQSGRPIEGAIVRAEVSANNDDLADSLQRDSYRAPKLNLEFTTTSDGTFEIVDHRGFTLTLLSIEKDGMTLEGRQWFSYSVNADDGEPDFLGEASDPIVFRMTDVPN